MHMRTLNMREVISISTTSHILNMREVVHISISKPSHLGKWLPSSWKFN